jgi:hypothetical protein
MSNEISIQDALARLEAGKFSFQMSDCISNHIAAQTQKIAELDARTDQAGVDIMKRDLRIHVLEKEVAALNGMLLKAIRSNTLIHEGVEAAKSAKENFLRIAMPHMMRMTAEAQVKFAVVYEKMTRMIEDGWKDAPPQIKEFKQQLEKMTNDLYSKIKAAA